MELLIVGLACFVGGMVAQMFLNNTERKIFHLVDEGVREFKISLAEHVTRADHEILSLVDNGKKELDEYIESRRKKL